MVEKDLVIRYYTGLNIKGHWYLERFCVDCP